jgi:molecular chaperone GrpE
MTENILINTLGRHGLKRFDPSAATEDGRPQKFDPKLHEATFMAKAEDKQDGDIMFVQSKGYSLNGRVLRVSCSCLTMLFSATNVSISRPPKLAS